MVCKQVFDKMSWNVNCPGNVTNNTVSAYVVAVDILPGYVGGILLGVVLDDALPYR